jgi:hypothetical protein
VNRLDERRELGNFVAHVGESSRPLLAISLGGFFQARGPPRLLGFRCGERKLEPFHVTLQGDGRRHRAAGRHVLPGISGRCLSSLGHVALPLHPRRCIVPNIHGECERSGSPFINAERAATSG